MTNQFKVKPKEKSRMSEQDKQKLQIAIDPNALYLEETFTDLKVGRIRKLTPVRIDGGPDKGRKSIFVGETQLAIKGQVLPIQCDIDALGLADAVEKFPEAVHQAFEQIVKEAEDAQKVKKEEESRIIIPK
jgi:hypothetical protein